MSIPSDRSKHIRSLLKRKIRVSSVSPTRERDPGFPETDNNVFRIDIEETISYCILVYTVYSEMEMYC